MSVFLLGMPLITVCILVLKMGKMRNILSFGILITIFLFLVSCQKQEEGNCPVVDFGQAEETTVKDVVSSVEVIPLQNQADKFLPDVNVMYVTDAGYVVSDSRNIIYVFSKDGKYMSDSKGRIGNGPNEYSIVSCFSYNPYSKDIEIVTPKHFLSYDMHFKLTKKIEAPTKMSKNGKGLRFFGHIYDLSANQHVLIPDQVSSDKFSILLFDSSSSEILKTTSFAEDVISEINMQDHCFFDNENSVEFFPPLMTNYLYSFDKKNFKIKKKLEVKAGKNGLTQADIKQFGNDEAKLRKYLLTCDKEIPVNGMATKTHVFFLVKKGNDLRNWFTLVYDKSSHQIKKIHNFVDGNVCFPVLKNVANGYLYGVVERNLLPGILKMYKEQGINVIGNYQVEADCYVLKLTIK